MDRATNTPTVDDVAAALKALLLRLPGEVVASVIYGSVATGRHHAGSDVDALLITARLWSEDEIAQTVELYDQFVTDLGLRIDPTYPVEVFSLGQCRRAVSPTQAEQTPAQAAHPQTLSRDDVQEIRFALSSPHLVVAGERLVGELAAAAQMQPALKAPGGDRS